MIATKISVLISILLACVYLAATVPWEPEPRDKKSWRNRHKAFVNNSRENGANINIVFMGSSSMERWSTTAESLWESKYEPLGAVNYGIGRDKIENCLWRIQNGELENMNPKLLVLYCGSNNVPRVPSADDIYRGIKATLDDLAVRLPNTKVLYVAFNARQNRENVEEIWGRIKEVNRQVALLHDGDKRYIFNMFDEFVAAPLEIKTEFFEDDLLHFNEAGYERWDTLWNTTFFNLLNG